MPPETFIILRKRYEKIFIRNTRSKIFKKPPTRSHTYHHFKIGLPPLPFFNFLVCHLLILQQRPYPYFSVDLTSHSLTNSLFLRRRWVARQEVGGGGLSHGSIVHELLLSAADLRALFVGDRAAALYLGALFSGHCGRLHICHQVGVTRRMSRTNRCRYLVV